MKTEIAAHHRSGSGKLEGSSAEVVVLGSGGHAKVLIDILRAMGGYEVLGCLSPDAGQAPIIAGVGVIGDRSSWDRFLQRNVQAAIGVGGWKDNELRRRVFRDAREAGFRLVTAVHPGAHLGLGVRVGAGSCVFPGAVLNTEVDIGRNVIVATGATIDHETTVGDHALVSAGVAIGGQVTIGAGALVAIGATVASRVTVGDGALVAAGAVVVDDVPDGATVFGIPARRRETGPSAHTGSPHRPS